MLELYVHQQGGVPWLAQRRVALLADEMGLGKTIQAIVAADLIGADMILVICPAIARDLWAREFSRAQRRNRRVQVIRSAADARKLRPGIIIVSYSLIAKVLPALRVLRFDVLILDEAQALKSIDAVRTKAVYGRGGLIACVLRVWLLSGTIMPNHPGEIWPHYRVLFKGPLLYQPFVERYCLTEETPYGTRIIGTNPAHTEELARFLAPHVLQRRVRDVLSDLPPLRWGHIPVRPDEVPPQPEVTPEIEAILHKLEHGEALSIIDQMALASLRRWTGIAKAPAVLELIRAELEGIDKIVVFAVHREFIAFLQNGLGALAESIHGGTSQQDRQALIDAFQTSDSPRVLIVQITTGGTAITLTRAHRVVFAETTWTPADMAQAAARCHRIGQSMPVLASVVSLAGSIDERIAGVLTRKAAELAGFETLLRKHQQEIATS